MIMNKKRISIPVLIVCISFLAVTMIALVLGAIAFKTLKSDQKLVNHLYVVSVVSDKYINEGYAGVYFHKDTEYVLVTEYKDGNAVRTITSYVDASVYNSYSIGDTVIYCYAHDKIENYE